MSKYTEYKLASIKLEKVVGSIERAQSGGLNAQTIDLTPDGNYRLRLVVEDGKTVVWTERWIPGTGFTKV